MRLINAKTRQLEEPCYDTETRPPYAILSHRWEHGKEVTFQDMTSPNRETIPGWVKIDFCCRQALEDGYEYAWVDTCCIDKTSSAEMSEAINSMYAWYADSQVCYAYLNDVQGADTLNDGHRLSIISEANWDHNNSAILKSKWWTRAWTLQELLAPKQVRFYDQHFRRIGVKHEMCHDIAATFGIYVGAITDAATIPLQSVAARMSWATGRKATRVEDRAYSLFGLFGVHLPLLYGEGKSAFERLQEEIIRRTYDQSIFAWEFEHGTSTSKPIPLLADSPDNFWNAGNIFTAQDQGQIRAYGMENIGLSIDLQLGAYIPGLYFGFMDCSRLIAQSSQSGIGFGKSHRIGMFLAKSDKAQSLWFRIALQGTCSTPIDDQSLDRRWKRLCIQRNPRAKFEPESPGPVGVWNFEAFGKIQTGNTTTLAWKLQDRITNVVRLHCPGLTVPGWDNPVPHCITAFQNWHISNYRATPIESIIPAGSIQWPQGMGCVSISAIIEITTPKEEAEGIQALILGHMFDFQPMLLVCTTKAYWAPSHLTHSDTQTSCRFLELDMDRPINSQAWRQAYNLRARLADMLDDKVQAGFYEIGPGYYGFVGKENISEWTMPSGSGSAQHVVVRMRLNDTSEERVWTIAISIVEPSPDLRGSRARRKFKRR